MKKQKNNKDSLLRNQGFTLIELMTVMAIIGILASAIMVSLSVQKKRATLNKTLTELSGMMENIYLCKSDDGVVSSPSSNNDVCNIDGSANPSYGQWPVLETGFTYGSSGDFTLSNWTYSASNGTDIICCTAVSGKCVKKEGSITCP